MSLFLKCNWLRPLIPFFCLIVFAQSTHAESLIPESERRNAEQTYLTYPEWFLVHSPAEYAELTNDHPAHEFPFIGHIGQLWSSYIAVTKEQIELNYPANFGYHMMIMVIASSTTLEYGIRSLYENIVGRSSYFLSSNRMTEEEILGADVAQQYVDFIRRQPWYLFDFKTGLKRLWMDTDIFGSQPLRKLERRYALTTEYVVKAIYAKLIELATRAAYDEAKMTTWVVVSGVDSNTQLPAEVILQQDFGNGNSLLVMPRYEAFTKQAIWLAQHDGSFVDIAGNNDKILISIIAPDSWMPDASDKVLFIQPILTRPGEKRVALSVPVNSLTLRLADLNRMSRRIEHIYDY